MDRQKKIRREEADREHKETINRVTIVTLNQQLEALRAQADREKFLEQEEARLMVIAIY